MATIPRKKIEVKALGMRKLLPDKLIRHETELEKRLKASLQLMEDSVGGRKRLLDALLVVGHPSAHRLISLMGKKGNLDRPLLELCRAARTPPEEVVKIFTEGSLARSTVETFVKLADGVPGVMDAAIESAKIKGPSGFSDRKLVFEMAGIAKPDGPATLINQNFMNQMSMGSEGAFEKVVSHGGISLNKNPFDSSIEVEND